MTITDNRYRNGIIGVVAVAAFTGGLFILKDWHLPSSGFWLSMAVVMVTSVMCLQGVFTLMWMLYAWEDPSKTDKYRSPKNYLSQKFTFTALLPARKEKNVIGDTIRAVSDINYPEQLKEIIVLCRNDDQETINVVNKTIKDIGKINIKLLVFDDLPINKPHSLNIGLKSIQNQSSYIYSSENRLNGDIYYINKIVTIFDAEDQPHRDIYNVINTIMSSEKVDVVQSGVQLMNYRSHWFSSINVLEYYFWFKSGLRFFSKVGNVTPLGGNTVFFKKEYLDRIGGWDENCLTEDADVGIRLATEGAKIRVVYSEKHVTKEETPDCVKSLIKQRTRWNHGFMQILLKGEWKSLPQMRQKFVALYALIAPMLQICFLLYLPTGMWIAFHFKLPVIVALVSYVPTYLFLLQTFVYFVGIREFTKSYELKYSLLDSLKILLVFIPYQIMMTIAAVRAIRQMAYKQNLWEKTNHNNAHREPLGNLVPSYVYTDNNI